LGDWVFMPLAYEMATADLCRPYIEEACIDSLVYEVLPISRVVADQLLFKRMLPCCSTQLKSQ
jgi:hypothetical protein